jgi:pSer/pThr/pTyr-binding forkhead associated (FHA) protein
MVAILHPTGPGMQIPIDRAVVLIGRSPECDVVLDVSSKISRMHCALVQVDTAYYIRDLGSLNGVTVAGERVEKDVKLTNGTEVQIGDVKFLFLENVLPAARAAKVAPSKGNPVFIDETMEVLDVDEVEVVGPTGSSRPLSGATPGRMPTLRTDVDEVEIIDAEVIEDVEISEAIEIVEDVEIIEQVEVVDDGDIIEDVEIVEDVDIVEDVEVIDESPRRPRPRPRLR